MDSFDVPLSLNTLRWLAQGQWPSRLERAVRLWELLHRLYHPENPWRDKLQEVFGYTQLRDLMFSPNHPHQDPAQGQAIDCPDDDCLCKRPLETWVSDPSWLEGLSLKPEEINRKLKSPPFGHSHRTLRKELSHLVQRGWLERIEIDRGRFRCRESCDWPQMLTTQTHLHPPTTQTHLHPVVLVEDTAFLHPLVLLDDIAFLHPGLRLVVPEDPHREDIPKSPRRLFIQMDYIISDELQDKVDDYHEQLERFWGQMIQFEYNTRQDGILSVVTYPVCLHYVRRAKYLSAYGQTPGGGIGWHNFRLDRICSRRLTSLDWEDERIPEPLQALYQDDCLPSPEAVQEELEEAWGFNFYLPKALLIMRFKPEFAQRYVDNTQRHPTFGPIPYNGIPALIQEHVQDPKEKAQLLDLVAQRPATDSYFTAWIRLGDTNLTMRLRDWRPNGEVLAPLALRQQMRQEAQIELEWYES